MKYLSIALIFLLPFSVFATFDAEQDISEKIIKQCEDAPSQEGSKFVPDCGPGFTFTYQEEEVEDGTYTNFAGCEDQTQPNEASQESDGCGEVRVRIVLLPRVPAHLVDKSRELSNSELGKRGAPDQGDTGDAGANNTDTVDPQKPYKCDWEGCGKAFARQSILTTHTRTHTGERPFKCDWEGCEQAFFQQVHLINHKRTHTRERPFKCDWEGCGQAFIESSKLTVHKRLHTDERLPCIYGCEKTFSGPSGLRYHKRICRLKPAE